MSSNSKKYLTLSSIASPAGCENVGRSLYRKLNQRVLTSIIKWRRTHLMIVQAGLVCIGREARDFDLIVINHSSGWKASETPLFVAFISTIYWAMYLIKGHILVQGVGRNVRCFLATNIQYQNDNFENVVTIVSFVYIRGEEKETVNCSLPPTDIYNRQNKC